MHSRAINNIIIAGPAQSYVENIYLVKSPTHKFVQKLLSMSLIAA
jgi:hypothetical protein